MPVDIAEALRGLMPEGARLRRCARSADIAGASAIVAVPAKNESAGIGDCLTSLAAACHRAGSAGALVVVNNSSDGTFERALAFGNGLGLDILVADIEMPAARSHAGEARGVAMDLAARLADPDGAVMCTDADTLVDAGWVSANLEPLRRGAALVCGKIEMDPADAARLPAAVQVAGAAEGAYLEQMRHLEALLDPDPWNPWPSHGCAGGASMATTVAMYRTVGGLPRLPVSEDRAFLARFRLHDLPVVFSEAARVVTSGRTTGRAQGGMADTVAARVRDPDAPLDASAEPAVEWLDRLRARAALREVLRAGADTAALCRALALPQETAQVIREAPTFGAAWQAMEGARRFCTRRVLHPADLAVQSLLLERIIATDGAVKATTRHGEASGATALRVAAE